MFSLIKCTADKTPSNLSDSTISMSKIGSGKIDSLVLGRLNTICFVFDLLIASLFDTVHWIMLLNSSLISMSVFSGTNRFVSSAYLHNLFKSDNVFRSLLKIMYKAGPNPEPWMMLRLIATGPETLPHKRVDCVRPNRNNAISDCYYSTLMGTWPLRFRIRNDFWPWLTFKGSLQAHDSENGSYRLVGCS